MMHPLWVRLARGLGVAAALLVAVILLVLLALQAPAVGTRVANFVLHRLTVAPRATLHVAEVRGNWLTHLEFKELNMARGDTLLASVQSARIDAAFMSLLFGRLTAERIELAGVTVSPGIAEGTPAAREGRALTPADILNGGFYAGPRIHIRQLLVREGNYASVADTAGPRLTDVTLSVHDLTLGGPFTFNMDSLALDYAPSGRAGDTAHLRLTAQVADDRLQIDTLRLSSPSSLVYGKAMVAFDERDSTRNLTIQLRAAPLSLADLALFAPGPEMVGHLTADIDLHGSRRDLFSGTVHASLDEGRFAGVRVGPGTLDAELTDGNADVKLALLFEQARLSVQGMMRPLDSNPKYDMALELRGLPHHLPGEIDWSTLAQRVEPTIRLQVTGERFVSPGMTVEGELLEGSGRVALSGTLEYATDLEWQVNRLAIREFDVARWVNDTTSSAINAVLTAAGRRMGDDPVHATATWSLAESHFGILRIRDGGGAIELNGARLVANMRAASEHGTIRVDDVALQLDERGDFRVGAARFSGVNLAGWTSDPALESNLNGTLTVTGRKLSELTAARASATANVTFEPSTLRSRALSAGDATLTLRGRTLDLSATFATDAGHLAFAATATPFDSPSRYELRESRFDQIDLEAWAIAPLPTRLTGNLTGTWVIEQPATPDEATRSLHAPFSGSTALRLETSSVGALALAGGTVSATLGNDQLDAQGDVSTAAGSTTFDASANFGGNGPVGHLHVNVPFAVLAALAERGQLPSAGELLIDGSMTTAASGGVSANVELEGIGHVGDWQVDSVFASLRLADGMLRVDTLGLRSNALTVRGAGQVVLADSTVGPPSDLRVLARVNDPSPLRAMMQVDTLALVDGWIEARLTGGRPNHELDVIGSLSSLTWEDTRLLDARFEGRGTIGSGGRLTTARFSSDLSRLQTPAASLDSARVAVRYDGSELQVDLRARLDDDHQARLEATATRDSGTTRIRLDDLQAVGRLEKWRLVQPAAVTFGHDRLVVGPIELRSESGAVRTGGVLDRNGTQDFRLELDHIRLGFITAWLGRTDLDGQADGSVLIAGTAQAPRAEGELRIEALASGAPAGDVESRIDWDGRIMSIDASFTSPQGDSLKAYGHVPLALSFAESDSGREKRPADIVAGAADLRIVAQRFPLGALEPLLPPTTLSPLRGTLDADLRLHGSTADLLGEGQLQLTGGTMGVPSLGVTYEDVEFHGTLAGNRFSIGEAHARSDQGKLRLAGHVTFPNRTRVEPQLTVSCDDFLFVRTTDLRVRTSAELQIGGTLTAPKIEGRFDAQGCILNLESIEVEGSQNASDVVLTPADVRMMEETFGYQAAPAPSPLEPIFDASDIDLRVSLGRGNWVRKRGGPRLAMEVTGEVHARKPPFGEFNLRGNLTPAPGRGYIEHFGRTFDFAGGEILLNGRPEDHTVNLRTEYKVRSPGDGGEPEVVVHLDVDADARQLRLVLSSEPSLPETDIISYITTGRNPTKQQADRGGADAAALATDIGLSQVTGALGGVVQEKISLDVLQIRYDPIQGATLIAGRYVDPSLYIGLQQPLQYRDRSTNSQSSYQTAIEVDYEAYRWLVLSLQGEANLLRTFIRARHAY